MEASVINFSWLVRLRWGAVIGQLITVLVVDRVMHIHLPLRPLLTIIATAAISNVACAVWARRQQRIEESTFGLVLVADVLLLTGLLYLSGGPFNPFSFLYLVHIALAAVVLSERWTWALAVLSLASFGALFLLPVHGTVDHSDASMHGEHLRMHLEGMWVAFGVAAGFIVYFVQRVTRALAAREAELSEAREIRERNEKFASLVTLAAGAAHELATPLATIAVVSKELERRLQPTAAEGVVEDARLIRSQVERCRQILSQMTADAGETIGEATTVAALGDVLGEAATSSIDPTRVQIELDPPIGHLEIRVPREALVRALANVINNGLQASPSGAAVVITAEHSGAGLEVKVRDEGAGMSIEVARRVGEPFFTTKPPGEGMGLGMYLTRAVLARLGGSLDFTSELGGGTTVALRLPKGAIGAIPSPHSTRERPA